MQEATERTLHESSDRLWEISWDHGNRVFGPGWSSWDRPTCVREGPGSSSKDLFPPARGTPIPSPIERTANKKNTIQSNQGLRGVRKEKQARNERGGRKQDPFRGRGSVLPSGTSSSSRMDRSLPSSYFPGWFQTHAQPRSVAHGGHPEGPPLRSRSSRGRGCDGRRFESRYRCVYRRGRVSPVGWEDGGERG